MEEVKELLAGKKDLLEKVATSLLEKETLESEEFLELVGLDDEKASADSNTGKKAEA